jgi:hypothetical protein
MVKMSIFLNQRAKDRFKEERARKAREARERAEAERRDAWVPSSAAGALHQIDGRDKTFNTVGQGNISLHVRRAGQAAEGGGRSAGACTGGGRWAAGRGEEARAGKVSWPVDGVRGAPELPGGHVARECAWLPEPGRRAGLVLCTGLPCRRPS